MTSRKVRLFVGLLLSVIGLVFLIFLGFGVLKNQTIENFLLWIGVIVTIIGLFITSSYLVKYFFIGDIGYSEEYQERKVSSLNEIENKLIEKGFIKTLTDVNISYSLIENNVRTVIDLVYNYDSYLKQMDDEYEKTKIDFEIKKKDDSLVKRADEIEEDKVISEKENNEINALNYLTLIIFEGEEKPLLRKSLEVGLGVSLLKIFTTQFYYDLNKKVILSNRKYTDKEEKILQEIISTYFIS